MKILTYNKLLVKSQDLGLYSGDILIVPDPFKGHPQIRWSGSIIDLDQFRIALAFLKWTHDTYKVESQIRLFYNPHTTQWKTVVLPQYIWSVGHTQEIEETNPVKTAILDDLLTSGFGQVGTGHHHSNVPAFQSSGDLQDEIKQNGFHFTVGNMSDKIASFHCRVTFRKINYDPNHNMIDPNQWVPGLHNSTIKEKEIAALWLDLTDLPPFPKIWKSYLRKKPVIQASSSWYHNNNNFVNYHTPPKRLLPNQGKKDGTQSPFGFHNQAQSPFGFHTQPQKPKKPEKKKETTHNALLHQISDMNRVEYDAFCQDLWGQKTSLEENQLNLDIQKTLATYRAEHLPEEYSALELEKVCRALQELSNQIVLNLHKIKIKHKPLLPPDNITRDLLISWGEVFFEHVLLNTTDDEWIDLVKTCEKNPSKTPFYQHMCKGIIHAMDQGELDPVYDTDGTISDEALYPL